MPSSQELQIAKKTLLKAGRRVMEVYHSGDLEIAAKTDKSPVTKADRMAHQIITRELRYYFSYPIISEESEENQLFPKIPNGKVWVLDPLDGTKSFIEKRGEFSIMLALLQDFEPILAFIYDICANTLYFAQKDKGSFKKERSGKAKRLKIKKNHHSNSFTMVKSRHHFTKRDQEFSRKIGIKNFFYQSSIGLKAASIAENKAALYMNLDGLNLWDIAPAYLLVKEAGGAVFDKKGHDLFQHRKIPIRFTGGIFIAIPQIKIPILRLSQKIYARKK